MLTAASSLFLKEFPIPVNFFLQLLLPEAGVGIEHFGPDFAGGCGPVTHRLSILEDHRPEDPVAAVCAVHMVGMDGKMPAFVSYQVFII